MLPDAMTPQQIVGVLLVVITLLFLIVGWVGRDFLNRLKDCVSKVEKGAEDWNAACERMSGVDDRVEGIDRRVTALEGDVLRRLKAIEDSNREQTAQLAVLLGEGAVIRTKVNDMWERRAMPRGRKP